MNFYEELKQCFDEVGIEGRIVEVPPELRPTPEDFRDLEQRIALKTDKNERMLAQSIVNAQFSLPVL